MMSLHLRFKSFVEKQFRFNPKPSLLICWLTLRM